MRDLGVITGWIAAAVDEPIPSAAMFDWWVRPRRLVQIGVSVVGVPRDETVLHPSDQRAFADAETRRGLLSGQHSSRPKSVITGAERVFVGEISDAQRGERSVGPSPTR